MMVDVVKEALGMDDVNVEQVVLPRCCFGAIGEGETLTQGKHLRRIHLKARGTFGCADQPMLEWLHCGGVVASWHD